MVDKCYYFFVKKICEKKGRKTKAQANEKSRNSTNSPKKQPTPNSPSQTFTHFSFDNDLHLLLLTTSINKKHTNFTKTLN